MPSPTPQCCRYWKGSLLVALDYSRQLYLLLLFMEYKKILNRSIWPINGALTDPILSGQSGPGSNDNEGVSMLPKSSELAPHHHYHHHVTPPAWISLTLSHHPSLLSIVSSRSSRLHPVSAQSCCIYALTDHPAFARPCERVYWSMSLMSLSLLLQQYLTCLVCLTWIVFMLGRRWPYSCFFVGCCLQNWFNISCSILV